MVEQKKFLYNFYYYIMKVIFLLILFIVIILITKNKNNNLKKSTNNRRSKLPSNYRRSKLPSCYLGGGKSEFGERDIAENWTDPDSSVLEFGGGAGSVSTIIQNKIKNKKDHVVIQPPENEMMGGIKQLIKNQEACNSKFQIIDHILKEGEEDEVLKMVSKPFDLIVADCENCLHKEYKKNPKLFSNVNIIQVERDDDGSYDKLREELGMELIHIGVGCGGKCTSEVWIKNN